MLFCLCNPAHWIWNETMNMRLKPRLSSFNWGYFHPYLVNSVRITSLLIHSPPILGDKKYSIYYITLQTFSRRSYPERHILKCYIELKNTQQAILVISHTMPPPLLSCALCSSHAPPAPPMSPPLLPCPPSPSMPPEDMVPIQQREFTLQRKGVTNGTNMASAHAPTKGQQVLLDLLVHLLVNNYILNNSYYSVSLLSCTYCTVSSYH